MAAWLLRAIVMENVSARADGAALELPAAPGYRLEKEIKNVVTVVAKTCHYWQGHMPRGQKDAIGRLFVTMDAQSPLVVPADASGGTAEKNHAATVSAMADAIRLQTGLRPSKHRYAGWFGVDVLSGRAAIWIMRAMVASNVLSRREGTVLFVPVHPVDDPGGNRTARTLAHVHRLAAVKGVLGAETTP
jgi:hypothetical protein